MQNFNFKVEKSGITLVEYLDDEDIVVIPEKIKGKPIKKVSSMCFFSKENLKEVHFPKTVSDIEHNAFIDCPNLELIEVNNIRNLGNIFEDCPKSLRIVSNCMTNIKRFKKMFSEYDLTVYNPKNFGIAITDEKKKKAKIVYIKEKFSKVVIPDEIDGFKITEISTETFFDNKILESIELPEYLEFINYKQFKDCINLKEVIIKKNVSVIKEHAFNNCSKLLGLELPSNLEEIQSYAFVESGIESIILSSNLKRIFTKAFANTKNLKKIILNDELEQLGNNCFSGSSIKEIVLSKKLTKIPNGCFEGCSYLTFIESKGKITSLGNEAFSYCSSLDISEDFIEGLDSIGTNAFRNCLLPEKLILKNPLQLSESAFAVTTGLKVLEIKNETNLKELPDYFLQASKIEKVILDSNISKLGMRCFYNSNLREINMENITDMGVQVFSECQELREVIIPENLLVIPSRAFSTCKNLKSVIFHKSSKVNVFEESAFDYTPGLTKISCPSSLEIIKERCFYASGIKEIVIGDNLRELKDSVFSYSQLKEFIVPRNVKKLPAYLFRNSNIERITLHENIESIEIECFSNSKNLTNVYNLENTKIKELSTDVFSNCRNLTDVKLPKDLVKIGYRAFNCCTGLKSIEIPDKVTTIDNRAFYQAKIPNGLTFGKSKLTINTYAFGSCVLPKSLVIPENVESIKEYAFSGNSGLQSVEIKTCSPMTLELHNFETSSIKEFKISDSKIRAKLKNRQFFKENKMNFIK